jgi:tetratricopeptide (TPR) repeat protein
VENAEENSETEDTETEYSEADSDEEDSQDSYESPAEPSLTNLLNASIASYIAEERRKHFADQLKKEDEIGSLSADEIEKAVRSSTDIALLKLMFADNKNLTAAILPAWQEFMRRIIPIITRTARHMYIENFPDDPLSSDAIRFIIDAVLTKVNVNDFEKLRKLRNKDVIIFSQWIVTLTTDTVYETKYILPLTAQDSKLVESHEFQEEIKRLAFVHARAANPRLFPIDTQWSIKPPSKKIRFPIAKAYKGLAISGLLILIISFGLIIFNNHAPQQPLHNQIDDALDLYLASILNHNDQEARLALGNAKNIAFSMNSYGDYMGNTLISFYSSLPTSAARQIIYARKLIKETENTANGDNYNLVIKKASEAKQIFLIYQDEVDAIRADIQLSRGYGKTGEFEKAYDLINSALVSSGLEHYLYYKTLLLIRKGNCLSDQSKFNEATTAFNEAKDLALKINIPELALTPLMNLTAISNSLNNDLEAFAQARKALEIANTINYANPSDIITLKQLAGLSSYKLNQPVISENYLTDAIDSSIRINNIPQLVNSYAFAGIIQAEQNKFESAFKFFDLADKSVKYMTDKKARLNLETNIYGYRARAQALAGNFENALNFYSQALNFAQESKLQEKLLLSQLYQGQGECLISLNRANEAEKVLLLSSKLEGEALSNSEESNTLLTFAVSHNSAKSILRTINPAAND